MQVKVKLETPIQRGEQTITEITLTKPNAGALRGLSVTGLLQMDINSLNVVLPRISTPTLTPADVAQLDLPDLLSLGTEVAGFFMPKSAQTDTPTT